MAEKNFTETANSGVSMNPYSPSIPSMTWNPLNDYINRNAVQPLAKVGKKVAGTLASFIPGVDMAKRQMNLVEQPFTTTDRNMPLTNWGYKTINFNNPDAVQSTIKNMESGLVDYLTFSKIPKSIRQFTGLAAAQTANDMFMDKLFPTQYDAAMRGEKPPELRYGPNGESLVPGSAPYTGSTTTKYDPAAIAKQQADAAAAAAAKAKADYQAGVNMINNLKNSMGINTQGLTDVQLASLNDAKAQAKKEYDTYMAGARKDISSAELAAAKGYGENARMYQGTMTDVENALTDFDMAKSPANYGGAQQSAGRNYDLANQTLGLNTANSIANYILGGRNAANTMNKGLSGVTDRASDYAMSNMNTLMSMVPMENADAFQKFMKIYQGGKY